MKTSIETITPQQAEEYLAMNLNNRSVRDKHVERIAKSITSNEWRMNGDSIKFNGSELVDGQHRLMAIVKAQKPVQTIVVRGLDSDIFAHIDTNQIPRQASDVIGQRGAYNANTVAAIIRMSSQYESGKRFTNNLEGRLTNDEVLQRFMEDDNYQIAAQFAKKRIIRRVISGGILGTWYYCTRKINVDDADSFWDAVSNVGTKEPISQATLLREKLYGDAVASRKLSLEHKFAYGVRAWNSFREGNDISRFQHKAGTIVPRFV